MVHVFGLAVVRRLRHAGLCAILPLRGEPYDHLSLSRLNHRLPGREANTEVVQGTADFHHDITDPLLPQTDPVFDDATTLDTTIDRLDP